LFTASSANQTFNSHKYHLGKALSTHPTIGNADGTKVQGVSSYYLIAVHEEADDECAHAQLIADIILL
jgi:hypothetical protein